MKSYPLRKKSQYDWLGEIPSHWNELFLQQVSSEKCVKNKELKETNVLSLSYGNIVRKKDINFGLVTNDFSTYQIVEPGDIILRFTDLQNDQKSLRTGLVCERGIITSAYVCIKPSINSAYLRFLLHAYDVHKIFYGLGGGIRQSIGFKDVRHMFVLVPPRSEQDQIVRYLDWQVSRIDKLIEAKKREIELNEELKKKILNQAVTKGLDLFKQHKPSLNRFLGTIPSHWEEKRIKAYCRIKNVNNVGSEELLSVFLNYGVIRYSDTNQQQVHKPSEDLSKYQFVEPGDLVLNNQQAWRGSVGVSKYRGIVSPAYFVLSVDPRLNPKFVNYMVRHGGCIPQFVVASKGVGSIQRDLNTEKLLGSFFSVPPRSEQDQIVSYLDQQVLKIDKMIIGKQKQIDLLKELQRRVISDAVTGRVDVRNCKIYE